MKKYRFRKLVSDLSSGAEILVSILILFCVFAAVVALVLDIVRFVGVLGDGGVWQDVYSALFAVAIQLVIGIELVKMIAKHTPDSVVEVLLFVVAKRVITESEATSLDVLLGVIAIAVLFAVKRYLHFDSYRYKDGTVFDADRRTADVARAMKIDIPQELGETLGDIVRRELEHTGRKMRDNETVELAGVLLRIQAMEGDDVKKIEVVRKGK